MSNRGAVVVPMPEMPTKSDCKSSNHPHCHAKGFNPFIDYFSFLGTDLAKKIVAEFIGTYLFVLCAISGPLVNQRYPGESTLLSNAVAAGLVVLFLIYSIERVSGTHLNSAVTFSLALFGHFPWRHVPAYIATQVAASLGAAYTLKGVFHPVMMVKGATVPHGTVGEAFFMEFLITFNLMFVITSYVIDPQRGDLGRISIAATVILNILIAGPSTGASMNPSRSIGTAVAAGIYTHLWLYVVAPVVGGAVAVGARTLVM